MESDSVKEGDCLCSGGVESESVNKGGDCLCSGGVESESVNKGGV